jgi:hypothetical protein
MSSRGDLDAQVRHAIQTLKVVNPWITPVAA